jgi:phospholipase/lecithinase/hemolysin
MIFSRIPGRRLRHAMVGLAVVAALAACGGGTAQYDPFIAQRLLAFGDETSVLTATGQKYSVNGTTPVDNGDGTVTRTPICTTLSNWVQALAALYGFVFPECNPNGSEATHAVMRAVPGARVDDIQVQIDAQVAAGGFRDKDLVAILAGANDIVELYRQFPGRVESDLAAEARARGRRLALQVNRLVGFGTKVIVSTVPDMGLSPFALKQRAEFNDTDRAALLSRLTADFNEQLGVNILLDGRFIGLVQADLSTQAMIKSPGSFGLTNVTDAACLDTVPLPDCTDQTMVDGASSITWMWADDLHLAYGGQAQIASLAIDRARRNPF